MADIRIIVPKTGLATGKTHVKVDAVGFKGQGCTTATKIFSDAIGKSEVEELKPEFYESPDEQLNPELEFE